MVIVDMVVRQMSSLTVPTRTMILEEIGGLSILLDDPREGEVSTVVFGEKRLVEDYLLFSVSRRLRQSVLLFVLRDCCIGS